MSKCSECGGPCGKKDPCRECNKNAIEKVKAYQVYIATGLVG